MIENKNNKMWADDGNWSSEKYQDKYYLIIGEITNNLSNKFYLCCVFSRARSLLLFFDKIQTVLAAADAFPE